MRIRENGGAPLAAWLISTMTVGFNGVYRENLSGLYNVPPGEFKTPPVICKVENLRAVSRALQRVTLNDCDFEMSVKKARRGDFVYFDRPSCRSPSRLTSMRTRRTLSDQLVRATT